LKARDGVGTFAIVVGVENDQAILGEGDQSESPEDEAQNAVNFVHFNGFHCPNFHESGLEDVQRRHAEVAIHHSAALVGKC